jgi:hypothetical protein
MSTIEEFMHRLPNDVGGLPSASFERFEHELKPWEKRCHALADVLDFHKIINTEEKRRGVEALGAEMIGRLGYYERWFTAFALILFQKGVLTPTELAQKMHEIEGRWRAEPRPADAAASINEGMIMSNAPLSARTTDPRTSFDLPAIASPETQEPARLIVGLPLLEFLSRGLVVIQYRAENLRIVAVFGPAARDVRPRIGHLHVTVDDAGWHWVDASGEQLIIQGLEPGPHSVRIGLADPTHRVIDSQTVHLDILPRAAR